MYFSRLDSQGELLSPPTPEAVESLREFIKQLAAQESTLGDVELLQALCKGGLIAAPLVGRKIAISGSAQQFYKLDAVGNPILGIGDAVAEGMLVWGGNVVLNSFFPSMDADRLAHLRSYGRQCDYLSADMSSQEGAVKFVRDACETLNGLDVLVLNAGTYAEPAFGGMVADDISKVFNLNFVGPSFAIQEFIKICEARGTTKARIVVTTSINAQLHESEHSIYDASKAALEAFIQSMALDIARRKLDIRINAVAPGLLYTPLTTRALTDDPQVQRRLEQSIPLGIGYPSQIVMPYLFLAMAQNDYMTGSVIDASGGLRIAQGTEIYER